SFGDIAIGPNGQVLVTFQDTNTGTGPANIFISLNATGSFAANAFTAPTIVTMTNVGFSDLIPGQDDSLGVDAEANLAWDRSGGPHNGRVYLAYTDAPTVGSFDTNIWLIFSDNNGVSWSQPVRVNDDTGAASQFLPAIALDQTTGTVAITWYDTRHEASVVDPNDTDGLVGEANDDTQGFAALSSDGGVPFSANDPMTAGFSTHNK